MESSEPYTGLPLPAQHSRDTAIQGPLQDNGFEAIPSFNPQTLLNFLPPHHGVLKGSMDFHEFSSSTRNSMQGDCLRQPFKMDERSDLMLDPFSSTQPLHDKMLSESCNVVPEYHQTLPRDFCKQSGMLAGTSIESDGYPPQGSNLSFSSHLFNKISDSSENIPSEFSRNLLTYQTPYSCDECKMQFVQSNDLKKHLESDHQQTRKEVELPEDSEKQCSSERKNEDSAISFQPQSVDENLIGNDTQSIINASCDTIQNHQDGLVGYVEKDQNGNQEAKDKQNKFNCSFCPKSCNTQEQLDMHEARHPYQTSAIQCSKCGEILGNYMLFKEHKQYEDYLSSCDICGQVFPNEECMICHIRNTHNDFDDLFEEEEEKGEVSLSSQLKDQSDDPVETISSKDSPLQEEVSKYVNDLATTAPGESALGRITLDNSQIPGAKESSSDVSLEDKDVELDATHNDFAEAPLANPDDVSEQLDDTKSVEEGKDQNESTNIPCTGTPENESPALETQILSTEEQPISEEQSPLDFGSPSSGSSKPLKIKCQYCSKKCSTRKSLIRHERCHPYGTAAMKCNLCLEVVENYKALKVHKKNQDSQVSCRTCNQICPNETCLSCHVRNVHNNSVYEVPVYSIGDDSNEYVDDYEGGEGVESGEDGFSSEQYSVSRYTVSGSVAPLRIKIKQEKEETYERLPSPTFSDSTPPTPPTPTFQGPPTPSPPTFVYQTEPSEEEEDEDEDDDEYEPYASDDSVGLKQVKPGKRKTSLRSTRRSSANSAQYSVSSEESDHDESGDFNYSPQSGSESEEDWAAEEIAAETTKRRTRRQNPLSDDDSDGDPDWRRAKNSSNSTKKPKKRKKGPLSDDSDNDITWGKTQSSLKNTKKKSVRKKGPLSDDDSDNDPDWNREGGTTAVIKKKAPGRRGRKKKKLQVQFFLPAIQVPKVGRPRARGLGGQKAQDAASALAQAVEDMETIVPELKTVIRPVRRSATKASLKRFSEALDDEYDYLLDVKQEPKEGQEESEQSVQKKLSSQTGNNFGGSNHNENLDNNSDSSKVDSNAWDQKEEHVVIKAEPYDFQDDEQSTDLYFSRKFCEMNSKYDNSNSPTSKHDVDESSDVKKEMRYTCKLCGRALQYRSHLIRHLRRVHDGEGVEEVMRRMMKCRFCEKPYTNELSLINHEKLHDGTSKMKCNKCDERFDDKNALRRHQRKMHWEHQPVECDICKKQLSDNTCLKAHMKHMHGAEEKKVTVFTCETCGRQLHTKTAFQNHVASKCGTNLLFPCDTCGKSFSFKGSLKAHQLLHTGIKSFLCKFCGKAFHQKGEMKRHERKHTGEKPFICEVCGRAFAYRESLLGHSAVHTGIKPFPCKACGMRFSCSGNLVKHRRSNNCKGVGGQNETSGVSLGVENTQESESMELPAPVVNTSDVPFSMTAKSSHATNLSNEDNVSLNEAHKPSNEAQKSSDEAHKSLHSASIIEPEKSSKQEKVQAMLNQTQAPSVSLSSNAQISVSHIASVIKSPPSIHVKPTSVLQSGPKESKVAAHVDVPQTHTNQINLNNRLAGLFNPMYTTHDNSVTVQSNFSSLNSAGSYSENHFRQTNQVVMNDRRYAQFNVDSYGGRTDQYFDRQSLMQHEMSRQVIDRSVDRQTPRFLDWTSGVQFSGVDSRGVMQSYPTSSISNSSGYSNIHTGHLSNYPSAHTTNHTNSHANMYGNNSMMSGSPGFPPFPANNHIGGYASNNPIPAHTVAHSSSYPTSHMSHLEALFGHFSHPTGTMNNSFPRLSSHNNAGSPANPSSNHRV